MQDSLVQFDQSNEKMKKYVASEVISELKAVKRNQEITEKVIQQNFTEENFDFILNILQVDLRKTYFTKE